MCIEHDLNKDICNFAYKVYKGALCMLNEGTVVTSYHISLIDVEYIYCIKCK